MIQYRVDDEGRVVQTVIDEVVYEGDSVVEDLVKHINGLYEVLDMYSTWSGITKCEERLAYINNRLFQDMINDAEKRLAEHKKNGDENKAFWQRVRMVTLMECQTAFYDMDLENI